MYLNYPESIDITNCQWSQVGGGQKAATPTAPTAYMSKKCINLAASYVVKCLYHNYPEWIGITNCQWNQVGEGTNSCYPSCPNCLNS